MGTKGPINAVFDVPAVNEIIVFANQYIIEVDERVEIIQGVVRKLTADESLNGGDGEEIKASLLDIAEACRKILSDNKKISAGFNAGLERMLEMRKGKTTAESKSASKKMAKTAGVLKE